MGEKEFPRCVAHRSSAKGCNDVRETWARGCESNSPFILCVSGESEAGLDEGVEEGCSSLEPLSQDDCSSDCSASCSRRVRNQPEPLSLTVGDPFMANVASDLGGTMAKTAEMDAVTRSFNSSRSKSHNFISNEPTEITWTARYAISNDIK